MRLLLTTIITLCAIAAHSQTFLDGLRRNEVGKGTVTVVQSAEIDSLVNGTKQQQRVATATPESKLTADSKLHDEGHEAQNDAKREGKPVTATSANTEKEWGADMEGTTIDTRKKVMRNSYKMQGYRIQVFSGGNSRTDRQKAERAGADMKANFPSEPIYVHFYSPSWKCRMGNYKTVEEARELLSQVKSLGYNQACIVKGTISVQY